MLKLYAEMNASLIAKIARLASSDQQTLLLITACESDVSVKVLNDVRNKKKSLRSHNIFKGKDVTTNSAIKIDIHRFF